MKPNIAVLGATGVVGREILSILEEKKFDFNSIKMLASSRSAGSKLDFMGKEYTVVEAKPEEFDGVDIVLASAGGSTSLALAKEAAKRGCVYIDNSSAFRMENDVPLVIAGVNDDDLKNHKGIVANPNCSTSQLMLVLKPLHDYANIKRLIVSTYQAVSGAGLAAMNELTDNSKVNLVGMPYENKVFKYEIGFNLIPQIDSFTENGYTKEEMKMYNETRKMLHSDEIKVSATCVRVPVLTAHSESVLIETEKKLTPEKARELLSNASGVKLYDNPDEKQYPMPLLASGQDLCYVGRIREDIAYDNGLSFFVSGDQLRKGAATNAVQIAELLIK